ncbi:hypothetical protein ACFOGQ_19295 [Acinetobacter vivianii]
MKKFIYIFLIFFSFLGISSAYAVDNFTPPQDLGTGGQVPPTTNSGGNNQISDEVSQVTEMA